MAANELGDTFTVVYILQPGAIHTRMRVHGVAPGAAPAKIAWTTTVYTIALDMLLIGAKVRVRAVETNNYCA